MQTIYLLDYEDTINPNDYYRPLNRSADYSQSDSWMEVNCYGGGPLDHLKWAPVWLILGEYWWGKKYKEYKNFNKEFFRPFEAVRGKIPESNILKGFERRHPLWFEGFLKRKKELEKFVFPNGKYKGRSIKDLLENCYGRKELIDYFSWYFENVKPEYKEKFEEYLDGDSYKIYYEPSYKKYKNANNI